ncbi:hypothetical protein D8B26_003247 [Coccidioides posadasii str. Silveira]|uniref:uncharacterized protein n=1 Tax=Coccidioides posadasii (strain RMSCC 757 / Silveira) TaxID=443226 RepID=UPI001BF15A1C|nr:hypothetical protein D8B26_003247 [Coccidioides posadasii str. Silveira]
MSPIERPKMPRRAESVNLDGSSGGPWSYHQPQRKRQKKKKKKKKFAQSKPGEVMTCIDLCRRNQKTRAALFAGDRNPEREQVSYHSFFLSVREKERQKSCTREKAETLDGEIAGKSRSCK